MPVTIIPMADEFEWDMHLQGWILSSFSIGYFSSLIVGGSAAKKYGGRRVLTLAVLLWSLSSFLTPYFAASWHLMILFRFLLGVGEGIGLPTIFHIFSYTIPVEERGRASFGDFEHMNSADYHIPTVPINSAVRWLDFLTHRSLWAIYAAHFSMNWSNYIVMQWLPTYLVRSLGATNFELTLTAVPYILNSVFGISAGHLADNLVRRRWSVLRVRQLMTSVGLIGPGFLLLIFSASSRIYLAVLLISISMGLSACNAAGHLASHSEVAPNHAGITFAVSNTLEMLFWVVGGSASLSLPDEKFQFCQPLLAQATIPGILCGPLTAHMVTQSGRWFPVFIIAGLVNILGAGIYLCNSSASPIM
ncbi:hypothetical protein ACTXT7_005341 [Hymenolepis weldensis]